MRRTGHFIQGYQALQRVNNILQAGLLLLCNAQLQLLYTFPSCSHVRIIILPCITNSGCLSQSRIGKVCGGKSSTFNRSSIFHHYYSSLFKARVRCHHFWISLQHRYAGRLRCLTEHQSLRRKVYRVRCHLRVTHQLPISFLPPFYLVLSLH